MLRRRALLAAGKKSRLPSGYQEVEWIQTVRDSSWFEFTINTSLPNFSVVFQNPEEKSWTGLIFFNSAKTRKTVIERDSASNPVYRIANLSGNTVTGAITTTISVYSKAKFDYLSNHVIVNGTDFGALNNPDVTYDYLRIGQAGSDSAANNARQTRLFELTLYDNNMVPFMVLVPCYRKSDNTKGIFDLISKSFNDGAGSKVFYIGDAVN